jgi:FKBP-type peptidyl-prolyl cis-trans isomerase
MKRQTVLIVFLPIILFISLPGCEKNKPPVCTIVTPEENLEIEQGATVSIEVEVYDPDGSISMVEFYINDSVFYSTPDTPFNYELSTRYLKPGEYTLRVTAIDQEGAEGSDECILKVIDPLQKEKRELEEYLQKYGITVEPTASGLFYIPLREGNGQPVDTMDIVDFQYDARLLDGTVIFTSNEDTAYSNDLYDENTIYGPRRIQVAMTGIAGLDEGLSYMREGGMAMLIMPPDINGFGLSSVGRSPPNSTHIYTVEIIHAFSDPAAFEQEQINLFLSDHQVDSFEVTNSGLYYIEESKGVGDLLKNGDSVSVWYTGYFLDGRIFGSNLGGQVMSIQLPATGFIPAWDEALKLMRKETRAKIIVPYSLGYGAYGSGQISPFMTLVFEMEISDVKYASK